MMITPSTRAVLFPILHLYLPDDLGTSRERLKLFDALALFRELNLQLFPRTLRLRLGRPGGVGGFGRAPLTLTLEPLGRLRALSGLVGLDACPLRVDARTLGIAPRSVGSLDRFGERCILVLELLVGVDGLLAFGLGSGLRRLRQAESIFCES